jgi:hypothetical protein
LIRQKLPFPEQFSAQCWLHLSGEKAKAERGKAANGIADMQTNAAAKISLDMVVSQ